jgi:hypothetical protein
MAVRPEVMTRTHVRTSCAGSTTSGTARGRRSRTASTTTSTSVINNRRSWFVARPTASTVATWPTTRLQNRSWIGPRAVARSAERWIKPEEASPRALSSQSRNSSSTHLTATNTPRPASCETPGPMRNRPSRCTPRLTASTTASDVQPGFRPQVCEIVRHERLLSDTLDGDGGRVQRHGG